MIVNFKRKLEVFKRSSEIVFFSRFGPLGFCSEDEIFTSFGETSREGRGQAGRAVQACIRGVAGLLVISPKSSPRM